MFPLYFTNLFNIFFRELETLFGKQTEQWGEDYTPPYGVFSYHLHNGGTQNTMGGTSNYQRFSEDLCQAGDEATTKHYVSVFPFTILLFDACTYEVYYAKCQVY